MSQEVTHSEWSHSLQDSVGIRSGSRVSDTSSCLYLHKSALLPCAYLPLIAKVWTCAGWLHGTAVERWSLTGKLSLSCSRPTADG